MCSRSETNKSKILRQNFRNTKGKLNLSESSFRWNVTFKNAVLCQKNIEFRNFDIPWTNSNRDLALPKRWSVVSNDDQLSLAHSQGFQGLFVTQLELAGLHNQSQSAVDGLNGLLLLLLDSHVGLRCVFGGSKWQMCSDPRQSCVEKEERKCYSCIAFYFCYYLL